MSRYVLLNLIFLTGLVLVCVMRRVRVPLKTSAITLASLLVLTAVFDNLIIWSGIVAYHSDHLFGIYVGRAPLEDFAYTVGAWLIVMIFWGHDEK